MLGTRERTLLLESLRPPAGYRLRRAVGTSFTLDLMALLTAPLAFTFFDAHDEEGAPLADPLALLEALRRHAERVTLFCQAGAIAVPRPDQKLLAYLETSVIEVQPEREGGIFHPKLWVLNFSAEESPDIYRVLCLSRNLTFARAWDTCVRLEGPLKQRQRGYWRNKPFADFLLALPGLATRQPIGVGLHEDLKRMAYEIRRVDFEPPPPFHDFQVHNFGLRVRRPWPFPQGGRSLVISPFLAGSTVGELVREHGLDVLISRPEAFEEVGRHAGLEVLPRTCYVLSPGAGLDARDAEEEREEPPDGVVPVADEVELAGLHAKLFLFERGREARLFTGSANATGAAFRSNVELLVELVGKKRDCGIDALLGLEEDPRLDTLRSLLQEYHPPQCPEPERPDRGLERDADRLVRILAATPFTAIVQDVDAEQRFDMTLLGDLSEIPVGAEVKVWPVTLPPEAAARIKRSRGEPHQPVRPGGSDCAIATFLGVSFEALSAFFALEVLLREDELEVRRRFVVVADLVGAPENRSEQLLRSLLDNPQRVLHLLLLILMGEGADVSDFVQGQPDDSARQASIGGWGQTTLLEALLRSLSRDPGRIDDVARLVSDLKKTPEGMNLLPEGLSEVWEPVWAAREALKL